MAEPVRKIAGKTPTAWQRGPNRALPDDEDEGPGITLLRWVEGPDGELTQVAMPLTPELFLHTEVGDQMSQGTRHSNTARRIADLLDARFESEPDVLVTFDLKHRLGSGLPYPSPDVSVIRGVSNREADRYSFNFAREGNRPCLIVEVVSPLSSRIRKTDLEAKVEIYEMAGIPEYIIVDSTRRDRRFHLLGYRLDGSGHYRDIEPDAEGRLLSETTGIWFQVSPDGQQVLLFESLSGRQLLTRREEAKLRKAAEEKARLEEKARRAAEERARAAEARARGEAEARRALEDEVARLRAEIERRS